MSVRRALVLACVLPGAARAESPSPRVAWADLSASQGLVLLTEGTRVRAPWQASLELGGFVRENVGLGLRGYFALQPHATSSWPSMFAVGAQAVAQYWFDDHWLLSGGAGFGFWWFCCDSMTSDPDGRGTSLTIPLEASIRYMHGWIGGGLTAMTSTIPFEDEDSSATFHWSALLLSLHVRATDHR
jgi:hypothetical protein